MGEGARTPRFRRRVRIGAAAALALVFGACVMLGYPADPRVHTTVDGPTAGRPTVRFDGVSTLLFDDGTTMILTDGFFSRPGFLEVVRGKDIGPDDDAISRGLERICNGDATCGKRLAAVVPLHAHYDHAMDAPRVAQLTGAELVGDASVRVLLEGAGLEPSLPPPDFRDAVPGKPERFGAWTLTFIPSRHGKVPFGLGPGDGPIRKPFALPASSEAMTSGAVWSLLIEHDPVPGQATGPRYLVHASAGFEPGALQGTRADVVFLGVGFAGWRSRADRQALWDETVGRVGATRVVLVHWDSLFGAPGDPPKPVPFPVDRFGATWRHFDGIEGVELSLPAGRAKPFDPLPPPGSR